MQSLEIAHDATTKALNSENSAMDENEKHLKSISGRLGTLISTIQEKISEGISADIIKNILSTVTSLVDAFGSLRNVVLLVVAAISI
jgi:hypothetical protein